MLERRLYSRPATADEKAAYGIDKVTGVGGTGPKNIITRQRRCQNCTHFDQSEAFSKVVKHCIGRDAKVFRAQGKSERFVDAHLAKLHQTVSRGFYGFCTVKDTRTDKGAAADFTHLNAFCDRWTGTIRPDGPDGEVTA